MVEYVQQVRAALHQTDQDVHEIICKMFLDLGSEEGDCTKRQKGTQDVISPRPNTKAHKGQSHAPDESPRTPKPAHKAEGDPRRKDKWVVGTGKAQVTVQWLDKRNDHLRPVSITEINDVDPTDLHRVCPDVFKQVGLDFTNLKSMARQHGKVIMWVQGDQASDLMVDGSKTEELALTSEGDPSKVDHVHVRELGVLEAMRRVGGLVPNLKSTTTAKHSAMEVPVTGVMLKDRKEQIFTALLPYTAIEAFISMWGYGQVEELDDMVQMSTWGEEKRADVHTVTPKYGIWQQVAAGEDKIKGVHSDQGEAQQWDGAANKRLMEMQHVDAFPKHTRESYIPKVHKTVGLPRAKKRKTDKKEIDLLRVLPPHLVGTETTGRVGNVGRRQVYLVGARARQQKGKGYSGDYVCGAARFQLTADKAVIATQGICSVRITDKMQEVDTTVKLWMVVQATMEGYNQQVVVKPHGVTARRREPKPVDH